ncbi:hypothetical protein QTG56_00400 [Rossellomorea sp. AcN35-11]|nr:hypothetical protein [Rossellomorea aquimaris]WJV29675.1 hypothetical protein QTG56_00400 [Rossellomorea sp. AcN35-11]
MKTRGLVVTNTQEGIHDVLHDVEIVRVIDSFGADISHPYGCSMRNIILSIYQENIDAIYLLFHKESKDTPFTKEYFQSEFSKAGISPDTIKTIQYMNVVGGGVYDWLLGSGDPVARIKKNMEKITGHPLIPKHITVHGWVIDGNGKVEIG